MTSRFSILLAVVALLAIPEEAPSSEFRALRDTERSASASFEEDLRFSEGIRHRIRRINVDGPYYDGLDGYSALTIRTFRDRLATPEETATHFVRGQFRLFGVDTSTWDLYAYRLEQRGAGVRIRSVVLIRASDSHITELAAGSGQGYFYASVSPLGTSCILFGEEPAALNLLEKCTTSISLPIAISHHAPDSPSTRHIGGGGDLSEEYLRFSWTSETAGTLLMTHRENEEPVSYGIALRGPCFAKD